MVRFARSQGPPWDRTVFEALPRSLSKPEADKVRDMVIGVTYAAMVVIMDASGRCDPRWLALAECVGGLHLPSA